MHEFSVTKSIFQIVQNHAIKNNVRKVLTVNLEIGVLSDLQNEWIQRYFDHLSKGSVVEGAKLIINRIPAVFHCKKCKQLFEITSLSINALCCQHCQAEEVTLVSGKEYKIKNMEAEMS